MTEVIIGAVFAALFAYAGYRALRNRKDRGIDPLDVPRSENSGSLEGAVRAELKRQRGETDS